MATQRFYFRATGNDGLEQDLSLLRMRMRMTEFRQAHGEGAISRCEWFDGETGQSVGHMDHPAANVAAGTVDKLARNVAESGGTVAVWVEQYGDGSWFEVGPMEFLRSRQERFVASVLRRTLDLQSAVESLQSDVQSAPGNDQHFAGLELPEAEVEVVKHVLNKVVSDLSNRYDLEPVFVPRLWQNDEQTAKAWIRDAVRRIGPGFHPDTRADQYVVDKTKQRIFDGEDAAAFDESMDWIINKHGEDFVYEIALTEQRKMIEERG